MKPKTKKLLIAIPAIFLSIVLMAGGSIIYKIHTIKSAISGSKLQNKNFTQTIYFDYVNKWIVVNVKVEGSDREYPFIFDTGAPTVVSNLLLNDLNPASYRVLTSGKDKDTTNAFSNKMLILNRLSIGDVVFNEVGCLEMQTEKWDMLNCISAYGIIGCNIIKSCSFQIDYASRTLTLTDRPKDLSNYSSIEWLNYRTEGQETPIISAIINDSINVDLFLDTGMSGSITINSPETYQKLSGISQNGKVVKSLSIPNLYIRGETETVYKSLTLKPDRLSFFCPNHSNEILVRVNDLPSKKFDGTIGNGYFENYIITLDYGNKRVGYIPYDEIAETNLSTFGFSYFLRGNKLFVGSVNEGSKAQNDGLYPGDEILKYNEVVIADLPSDTYCGIIRMEYLLSNPTDSTVIIEVKGKDGFSTMKLTRYQPY
jgi:hypothetical protein